MKITDIDQIEKVDLRKTDYTNQVLNALNTWLKSPSLKEEQYKKYKTLILSKINNKSIPYAVDIHRILIDTDAEGNKEEDFILGIELDEHLLCFDEVILFSEVVSAFQIEDLNYELFCEIRGERPLHLKELFYETLFENFVFSQIEADLLDNNFILVKGELGDVIRYAKENSLDTVLDRARELMRLCNTKEREFSKRRMFLDNLKKKYKKIMVTGEGGVGRTTLMHRYMDGVFKIDTKMTVGVQFSTRSVKIEGNEYIFIFWDLGGQERWRFFQRDFCKEADAAILAFDLTRDSTLKEIDKWIKLLRNWDKDLPILLVGTKLDLVEVEFINDQYFCELVGRYNLIDYINISNKTGENVEELFQTLFSRVLDIPMKRVNDEIERKPPIDKKIKTSDIEPYSAIIGVNQFELKKIDFTDKVLDAVNNWERNPEIKEEKYNQYKNVILTKIKAKEVPFSTAIERTLIFGDTEGNEDVEFVLYLEFDDGYVTNFIEEVFFSHECSILHLEGVELCKIRGERPLRLKELFYNTKYRGKQFENLFFQIENDLIRENKFLLAKKELGEFIGYAKENILDEVIDRARELMRVCNEKEREKDQRTQNSQKISDSKLTSYSKGTNKSDLEYFKKKLLKAKEYSQISAIILYVNQLLGYVSDFGLDDELIKSNEYEEILKYILESFLQEGISKESFIKFSDLVEHLDIKEELTDQTKDLIKEVREIGVRYELKYEYSSLYKKISNNGTKRAPEGSKITKIEKLIRKAQSARVNGEKYYKQQEYQLAIQEWIRAEGWFEDALKYESLSKNQEEQLEQNLLINLQDIANCHFENGKKHLKSAEKCLAQDNLIKAKQEFESSRKDFNSSKSIVESHNFESFSLEIIDTHIQEIDIALNKIVIKERISINKTVINQTTQSQDVSLAEAIKNITEACVDLSQIKIRYQEDTTMTHLLEHVEKEILNARELQAHYQEKFDKLIGIKRVTKTSTYTCPFCGDVILDKTLNRYRQEGSFHCRFCNNEITISELKPIKEV